MKTAFETSERGGRAATNQSLLASAATIFKTGSEVRRAFMLTSHTILLVDDHAGIRGLFCQSLRELGYEVLEAEDALQAQRIASARGKVDLLLTAFRMPEMNGVQLARWFNVQFPLGKVVLASTTPWEVEPYLPSGHDFVLMQKKDLYSRLAGTLHDLLDEPLEVRRKAMCTADAGLVHTVVQGATRATLQTKSAADESAD